MRKTYVVAFVLLVGLPIAAQQRISLCGPRPDENCKPPATYQVMHAPAPFNAPARFGGAVTKGGSVVWLWLKAGEPSRACTAADLALGDVYRKACAAKVGDELYRTMPFILP